MNVIKTYELTKSFNKRIAVNKVSMTIGQGQIYGLIGQNGAGKTTIMKMICGFIKCSSGSIELFESKDIQKQRTRIGCMVERPALYNNMSAYENMEVHTKAIGVSSNPEIEEKLKAVGIEIQNKKVKHFSAGMKQRLAIAIALINNPDFLILDEPINNLDPQGMKDIRNLILKLNSDYNTTFLISSHILDELQKVATNYGILVNGRLVDEFSSSQLENRCKRCLKIKVNDAAKASNILETKMNIFSYDVMNNSTLRIFDNMDRACEINRCMVKNDISVESLVHIEQNLEQYFLDMIGDRQNDKFN